jgi:O-antigen/teichoic acid export membrane protein
MSARTSLFRDIAHYLSGRAALVLLGFATFPLMTRMLSVAQYGVVSLTLRSVLLLTVLSKCGLQYSAARLYDGGVSQGSHEEQRRFYSTLVLGPALTAAAVLCVYLPVLLLTRGHVADPMLYRCLLLAPCLVLLRTLQSLLLSLLRNEGRSLLHSTLEVVTKLLTLATFLVLLFGNLRSAFAILTATAVSEAAVVLLQLALLLRRDLLTPHALDWSLIRASITFGAPLIAYELSSIVLDSGDRFLVRHYLGGIALGYYSAAYNISSYLQEVVMTPLNLAIVPIYMRLWNEEGREATQRFLSTGLSWFSVAAVEVTALSILCSRDTIVLLASSRFLEAYHLLPILVPSLMLYSAHIFLNIGLILEKRTVLMATMVFLSALANLVLNIFLIPRIGLIGAAWVTLVSYVLLIAWLAVVNQRILPLKLNFGLTARAVFAAAAAYAVAASLHTRFPAATLALRIPSDLALFTLLLLLLSRELRHAAIAVLKHPAGEFHIPVSAGERGQL